MRCLSYYFLKSKLKKSTKSLFNVDNFGVDTKQRLLKQRLLQNSDITKQRLLQNSDSYKTATVTKQRHNKIAINCLKTATTAKNIF